MTSSLYDISVRSYLQVVDATVQILNKGALHFADGGKDPDAMVEQRMVDDMLPFSFQVRSVVHHSIGAIRGIETGVFSPPPKQPQPDYAGLQAELREAAEALRGLSPEHVNALTGKDMVFRMSSMELPFTAEGFVLSFSLPNFYFHATTTYSMLRSEGVPLGKLDFLGSLRLNR